MLLLYLYNRLSRRAWREFCSESPDAMKKLVTLLLEATALLTGLLLADSRPAHAYLDPGTGSYALQVTIAGVFGALFSVKMFWSNIMQTIRRLAQGRVRPGKTAPSNRAS